MITGIQGGIGEGKTLVMTKIGVEEYKSLGKPIFANYHLKGIPQVNTGDETPEELMQLLNELGEFNGYCYITFKQFLFLALNNYNFYRACFLIDEIHVWVDARMSNSKGNRFFTYMMLMTGKIGVNFYYTTQDFGQVEKRLRERTDIGMHVERNGNWHKVYIEDYVEDRKVKALIFGPEVYEFFDTTEVVKVEDLVWDSKKTKKDDGFKAVL